MDKIKSFIAKALTTWVGIGSALIVIGASGWINVPEVLTNLFSQEIADSLQTAFNAIFVAIGASIEAAQAIRLIFLPKKDKGAEVKVLSVKDKLKYALNPYKLNI